MQLDLEHDKSVFGVVTQGRDSHDQWVTLFKILYKSSQTNEFEAIKDDNGNDKVKFVIDL